jgi:hypothetical protein
VAPEFSRLEGLDTGGKFGGEHTSGERESGIRCSRLGNACRFAICGFHCSV